MMKYSLKIMLFLVAGMLVYLTSCKKDDPVPPTFTLTTLTADGIDLAGLTSAVNVPEAAVITAVFSSEVDATTASKTNFKITNTDDNTDADYAVSASGNTVTMTPTTQWDPGSQYSIALSTAIAGTNGANYSGNTLTFRTSGIFVPQKEAQALYINFDESSMEDATGNNSISSVGTALFTDDRRGTANSAAFFDGNGNLIEIAPDGSLINGTITISYWFKTDLADYDGGDGTGKPQTRFLLGLGVEKGYFLEVGRRSKDPTSDGFNEIFLKYATNHVNIGTNAGAVPKATAWSEINSQINVNFDPGMEQSGWSFAIPELTEDPPNRDYVREQIMGKWTHLVMVIDPTTQSKTFYVNGIKWAAFQWISSGKDWLFSDLSLKTENNDGSPIEGIEGSLALGFAGSSANTATGWADYNKTLEAAAEGKKFYKGAIDQLRIFTVALNDAEVAMIYENEK